MIHKKRAILLVVFLFGLFFSGYCTYADIKEFSIPSEDYSMGDEYKGVFPYSSVVKIKGGSRCTATVVGKDYAVTASHCSGADQLAEVYLSSRIYKSFPIDKHNSTYNKHVAGSVIDDYALLKISPIQNPDGSYTHIGDIVKPLTITPDTGNRTFGVGSELAVLGFPSWSNTYQEYVYFYATSVNDSKIHGNMTRGGGLSGASLLNKNAQILGIYHGGGSFAAIGGGSLRNDLLNWGLKEENSRIYVWKTKQLWSDKKSLINPAGRSLESKNGELVSIEDLNKLVSNVLPEGYHAPSLTDGINEINSDFRMPIGGLNLYPSSVEKNNYKVSFDKNADDAHGNMQEQSFTYDEAHPLNENMYTRENNEFAGWNTERDGSGKQYNNSQEVKNLTVENNSTVTLYAQWKTNLSSIVVHYVDEESGVEIADDTIKTGEIDSPYIVGAPSYIEDYELDSNKLPENIQGNFSTNRSDVIFNYRKSTNTNSETSSITVRYFSESLNTKLMPNLEITEKKGSTYAIAPIDIEGYQLAYCGTNNASGVLADNKLTIDFYYKKIASNISGEDFTMYVGDPEPTVSDFKAMAWDINSTPLSVAVLFDTNIDFNTPGKYKVKLEASDGQIKTVSLMIKENLKQISGNDYTMYVGDPEPTVNDFNATAVDKFGDGIEVYLDLNGISTTNPGVYPVTLKTNDGQEKKVSLVVIDYSVGDINKDKLINLKDLTCLKKYLNDKDKNSIKDILKLGDLNRDGQVNIIDYTLLTNLINND